MSAAVNLPNVTPHSPASPDLEVYQQPRWVVAYIQARHEKAVAQQLRERGVEHLLPLFSARRRWNDRWAQVELPLFPSYLFVHMPWVERLRVLTVPGVVRIVSFNGIPAVLEDSEIEALRDSLAVRKAEPHPYLATGTQVRVKSGLMAGLRGVVVRQQGKQRLIVSLEAIMRSIALDLDTEDVEPVQERKTV